MTAPGKRPSDRALILLGELSRTPDRERTGADLAQATGVPPATVSLALVRLASFGWIEYRPGDHGTKPVRLTPEGKQMARVVVANSIRRAADIATTGGPTVTLQSIRDAVGAGHESPAVLAAVQRALRRRPGE